MANPKVYIHELIDIIGHNRANYIDHVTARWAPVGRERNMVCFGVWATVGSTERWPEAVNLWELDGWKGLAANFRYELSHPTHQDRSLARWWAEAARFRHGGYDRILVPAPYSPTLKEAIAQGIRGDLYYHELVHIVPGKARAYLSMLEDAWLPVAARLGLRLTGAYRTAMVNDSEAVVIWAIDNWDLWADIQIALEQDPEVARWSSRTDGIAVDWRGKLLVPAPLSPLNTGKMF